MMNAQDKNIIFVYLATVVMAGLLIFVIMNVDSWFFSEDNVSPTAFTPAERDTVNKKDINTELFVDEKYKSLGPLLSAEELKRLEELENQAVGEGETPGAPSGTARPTREVRRGNPFIPFK